jgi:hypothetical protein
MKSFVFFIIIIVSTTIHSFSQTRNLSRGAMPGEFYFSSVWYANLNFWGEVIEAKRGFFRITENGRKLTINYNDDFSYALWFPRYILADVTPGIIYTFLNCHEDPKLWISYDNGNNWELRQSTTGVYYYSANVECLIYMAGAYGAYFRKSNDCGYSFSDVDIIKVGSEPGLLDGEFFSVSNADIYYNIPAKIKHTYDFYETYTEFTIDSQFVYSAPYGLSAEVFRGTFTGEVYVTALFSDYKYKVSFSDDYGQTFRHVYICNEDCYGHNSQVNYLIDEKTYFMSDREPGVFYILKANQIEKIIQNTWEAHLQICVDYYRDYGETLVGTYCHDLTKEYGTVCEVVTNLAAEQINDNSVMLSWSDESSLPVEGFLVFRDNEQITEDFILDTYYFDENLDLGVYEYYVVAHYTTGCVSDRNNITVKIEEKFEVTFEVKYDLNQPVAEAKIIINDVDNILTTNELGIAVIDLPNGEYDYEVSKTGYITVNGSFEVKDSEVSKTVTLEKEPLMYNVTFIITDVEDNQIDGATIVFNGNELQGYTITVPVGKYEYSVSKEGYISVENTVTVDNEDIEEKIQLASVGIKYNVLSDIILYPNPFTNEININYPTMVKNVQITNFAGQKMKEVEFNGNIIKTGNLTNGVYFVVIESVAGNKAVYKMIKK